MKPLRVYKFTLAHCLMTDQFVLANSITEALMLGQRWSAIHFDGREVASVTLVDSSPITQKSIALDTMNPPPPKGGPEPG